MPYGAFGAPIGHSRFSVGVGIFPDLLSVSQWRYVDAPGVAGTTYGLQFQKSAIISVRAVAGASVQLGPSISVECW